MITNGWVLPTLPNQIFYGHSEEIFRDPGGVPFSVYGKCYWEFKRSPHALLIGGTGSGKTTALKQITAAFINTEKDSEIFLCTFKHKDDDFSFLTNGPHFASYARCDLLFEIFYERFTARLNGDDSARNLLLLVFDEWSGFLLSLEKKEQEETLKKMGQILMLGRSMNVQIIVAMQRPDALFFKNGARDNFNLIIAMGNLSADGKHMVFSSEYVDQIQPCTKIGEGYALMGGSTFNKIRMPPPSLDIDKVLTHKLQ